MMLAENNSIGYWSCNMNNNIMVETKESEYISDVIRDANDIINFAKNIEFKPNNFNLITRKVFNLFNLSYVYYYSISLEFTKIKKTFKYDKTKK